jgi:hypothetical protein
MKAGKLVTYRAASGRTSTAVVVAVVGTGASGCKTLTLDTADGIVEDVAHVSDADTAAPAWTLDEAPIPVDAPLAVEAAPDTVHHPEPAEPHALGEAAPQ